MHYILGIDHGSSKTQAALCDGEGRILGVGRAGGAYHSRDGMPATLATIRAAAEAALTMAAVAPAQVELLYGGLTGVDWPDEYTLLHEQVSGLGLARRVCVTNDSLIALRGGTAASFGAILIAGTGGNCAVRAPSGETFIYHCYHDDDLQGGSALGRRALWAVYRSATGREPATRLTAAALELFGMPSVDALLRADAEGRIGPERAKHLAPLIFEATCAGDVVAAAIIRAFGTGMAELVAAGLRRLDMAGLPVEVVLSGSIFKGPGRLLDETIAAQLRPAAPLARLVNARYEPVVGALLLGLETIGADAAATAAMIEAGSHRYNLLRTLR